jgi:aspartate/methionine/tyrosine aminotransferase
MQIQAIQESCAPVPAASPQPETKEQSLTEIEAVGLESRHDLANGHASHELAHEQISIIQRLPALWNRAHAQKSREAEWMFARAFSRLARCPSLTSYEHFKVCPTASNSIDTVATWLAEHRLKTALIEPTFDNLYLILKRRGVALTSLPEEVLQLDPYPNLEDVDAVFLVNPNNPTGRSLSSDQFSSLVAWCAHHQKVVVLDNTFRFFVPQLFDMYQILIESGVTFLSIEDTGKVWPTQEIKASLLYSSPDVAAELAIIYDEIFLCASNFALGILTEFLNDAHQRGLDKAVWEEVRQRRSLFRSLLPNTPLTIHPHSRASTISVEWVEIGNRFSSDLALMEHFKARGLVFLPGRQFYWNRGGGALGTRLARFALLKPKAEFLRSLSTLETILKEVQS